MKTAIWLSSLTLTKISFVNTYYAKQKIYPIIVKDRYANCFIYTLSGTETYFFRDKAISTPPGSVLYIPKGENYTTSLDGEESVAIVVDFEMLGEVIRPFSVEYPKQSSPQPSFDELEQLWNKLDLGKAALMNSLFYRLTAQLIKQLRPPLHNANDSRLESALTYLHEHYTESRFKISDMIEISGVSQKYFNTLFRRKLHLSPKEYVISLKMDRAKKLLLSSKLSVSEIAEQLGYCDIYHFSKIFKTSTGYSPTQYVRLRKES